jgi:TatD DNase family protein
VNHAVKRNACFGIHPHQASMYNSDLEKRIKELLSMPGVIALGEIGLDFYYNYSPQKTQIEVFQKQLSISIDHQIPVMIHCRDAYPQLAEILRSIESKWRGMIHCFTGTPQEMEPLLELGFHISFSGIVTFRTASVLQGAARIVPIDRILVETDAPFLAPVPHRGKRNEPSFVVETARFVASLRGIAEQELSDALFRNFEHLFA